MSTVSGLLTIDGADVGNREVGHERSHIDISDRLVMTAVIPSRRQ